MRRLLVYAALFGILVCVSPLFPARAKPPSWAGAGLRPGIIVRFASGAPVCANKEDLLALLVAGLDKDQEVMRSKMHGSECGFLAPGEKVKVMSVEYHQSEVGMGLIEIEAPDADQEEGVWAITYGAEPVPTDAPGVAPKPQPKLAPKHPAKSRGD